MRRHITFGACVTLTLHFSLATLLTSMMRPSTAGETGDSFLKYSTTSSTISSPGCLFEDFVKDE